MGGVLCGAAIAVGGWRVVGVVGAVVVLGGGVAWGQGEGGGAAAGAVVEERAALPGAEDVADVPAEDLSAGGDERKRYVLIGPRAGEGGAGGVGEEAGGEAGAEPKDGYRLLIVMPGGPGGIEFHPFVKRIAKHALPEGYLVAQMVSVEWSEEQAGRVVWPTAAAKEGMPEVGFTTEEYLDAVVADVKGRRRIDERYVFTLSWSSSGPAAYAAALREETPVTGSLVAMSVFRPEGLPPLEGAEGRAFYILHSPEDRVCPMRMAEEARDSLKENGARVGFKAYRGGHGWRGPVYEWVREGVEWLEGEVGKGERDGGNAPVDDAK